MILSSALSVCLLACGLDGISPHGPSAHSTHGGPGTNDSYARGKKGCVVSADIAASRIGAQVLKNGGNAVDAAVATALALAVVHPSAGNLGGGGFMIIRMADGRTAALDFREVAPAGADRDMYLKPDGSVDSDKSRFGALAGGVPGSPAGMVKALELFGSKGLWELAAPSIRLAREGYALDHFQAARLAGKRRSLGRYEPTKAIFFDGDEPLQMGEMLVQEDLAGTLERFAGHGFSGFYGRETARRFAASMKAAGGLITEADLAGYEVKVREVLRGTYRGHEILSMPPASSGGVAVLQMLNVLEAYDLRAAGKGSARSIHLVTEAMRRAYADRSRWLGDSDFWKVPLKGLTSKQYANTLRASIRDDGMAPVEPGLPPGAQEGQDTTHFSVVDAAGNAVTCTTTINSSFGSCLVVDGLGFFLNNEMDDFSAKPGVPNQFGLLGGEANAIQPKKRMLSSMTPTMLLKDGKVRLVLGSPGGGRIINTVLQVIMNVVDHQLPLREAVASPRFHHQWKPEFTYWERGAINPDTRRLLEGWGHKFAAKPSGIGRCQAISIGADGTRTGVSDPRSGGAAVAN